MNNETETVNPNFWKKALDKEPVLPPATLSVIVWACLKIQEEEDVWGETHKNIKKLYDAVSADFWDLPDKEMTNFVKAWNKKEIKINLK
tara:strand:- start:209 stop:475 length:267 start_codon:yes stop_codon:yes gene_type:complete